MTTEPEEFFGSSDQIALMRRAEQLWALVQDSPDYSFYGRMVSLSNPGDDAFQRLHALAKLQGATSCQYYPASSADSFCADLNAAGMITSRYEQCRGGKEALNASLILSAKSVLPNDLTIRTVDDNTSSAQVEQVANLSLECGVMPVTGQAMRSHCRDGICLFAEDTHGQVVATASSYMSNTATSPHASDAFWGMLATHEDRRGEKIGPLLGAQVIISMWEEYGARSFNTGIVADNASSMAMCRKLGIIPSQWTFIGCMDPEIFGDRAITK